MHNILKNKKRFTKGLTLIEALFGISIFILIVLSLTLFSRNIWTYNSYISSGLADADTGRKAMKTMTAEIRTASVADTGAYVISLATPSAFTFYSDIDGDTLKERVRYFLASSTLQKGVIKPAGSPLSYNSANEKISTLASNVVNGSMFEYYDKDYSGTEVALPLPVSILSIRLVKITATIDKDINRAPTPMTFSTQVSLRNLKDNL